MKNIMLCLLLFFLAPTHAFGEDRTGNDLLKMCQANLLDVKEMNQMDALRAMQCNGMISGYWKLGMIYTIRFQDMPELSLFCTPMDKTVPPLQLTRIVVKYLEEHPEKLHENAAFLLLGSLQKAFPCPSKQE